MEEIQFNHTLPIQLRFNDVDKFGHVNNTVYFSFLWFRKNGIFRFRMPGCRLGKGWYRCRPYWSKFPCADLWFGPYCRANCRYWNRNQEFPSGTACHRYGNLRSKCVCTSIMVAFDLSKHESKPLEEEWIEAICKYEGKDLKKRNKILYLSIKPTIV